VVGVGLVVGIGLHMSILRDGVLMVSSGVVLPSLMVAMVSVGKPSTAVAGSPRGLRGLFSAGRLGAILVHNTSGVFLLCRCWEWSHLGYGCMSSCGVVGSGLDPSSCGRVF
jgi:hypothetical protein